jgi:hypothetical protein
MRPLRLEPEILAWQLPYFPLLTSLQGKPMRTRNFLVATAILGAFACSKSDQNAADSLALAAKNQATLDSISAAERAAAPVVVAPAAPVTRRTTTRRSSSGGSSSGTTTTPASTTTTVKHTKRDATIGAVTGAVIGAVTSKDKVKGAVVGGVVGGVLGGVIGNNVDKTKKK